MHRLLQGDVGSGKTVVALAALLVAVQGGYQGAFMAPTEVLAEQHYLGSVKLLDGLTVGAEGSLLGDRPVRVELLTNRTTAAERRRIAKGSRATRSTSSSARTRCSTATPSSRKLGLAVIDEQHRFGVEQRALLKAKANDDVVPDVLVMTATPIPRTAAMLVYGDLDKSELREMPPGRTPIDDRGGRRRAARPGAHVADACATRSRPGHQAYVVCPLVEDKGKVEAKAATAEFERLQAEELAGLRLGLLHGQLPVDGEGGGDGRVPRRRRSTCSSRRP